MSAALLTVDGLEKVFPIVRGGALRRTVGAIRAVDGVSFELAPGETLGLVGESGSGKSTLVRCLLRLLEPTAGRITFDGCDLLACDRRQLRGLRRHMQIVFQDPYRSLDPRMTVEQLITEPLRIHGLAHGRAARRARAAELLALVGLEPSHARRYPRAFSGGQRQRIAIARALATEPKLLVLDEAVSALDTTTRAQILALLGDLQARLGLGYLFVAHDLALVRSICDRVAVMYLGRIVELADRDTLFDAPAHPYTQALLSAMPVPDPALERRRRRIVLRGEAQSASAVVAGCRFAARCPRAGAGCTDHDPPLQGGAHRVACWYPSNERTPHDA